MGTAAEPRQDHARDERDRLLKLADRALYAGNAALCAELINQVYDLYSTNAWQDDQGG